MSEKFRDRHGMAPKFPLWRSLRAIDIWWNAPFKAFDPVGTAHFLPAFEPAPGSAQLATSAFFFQQDLQAGFQVPKFRFLWATDAVAPAGSFVVSLFVGWANPGGTFEFTIEQPQPSIDRVIPVDGVGQRQLVLSNPIELPIIDEQIEPFGSVSLTLTRATTNPSDNFAGDVFPLHFFIEYPRGQDGTIEETPPFKSMGF